MAVAAVSLGSISVIRRTAGAKVVFSKDEIIVVNPVFTYGVPHGSVKDVGCRNGSLIIWIAAEGEVRVGGFSGSLIDHFWKTSEKAAKCIREKLEKGRGDSRISGEVGHVKRRITRAWVADLCAAFAIFAGLWAGMLGI